MYRRGSTTVTPVSPDAASFGFPRGAGAGVAIGDEQDLRMMASPFSGAVTGGYTTLAFRHAAEVAVVEPPTSQREVDTSHPDRASRADRFRPCCLLRARPDP
jgi:hypothetical protein